MMKVNMVKIFYNEYELTTGQKDDQDWRTKQLIYGKHEDDLDWENMIVNLNMGTLVGKKFWVNEEQQSFFPKLT